VEFGEYVAARGRQLVRLGYVLSADHQQAEDLAQSALLAAYRHWRRVGKLDDPHVYVRRVLVNVYVSAARRRTAHETPMLVPEAARVAPDPAVALAEHDAMWRALRQLPRRERTVLVLRYYEDLDYASIAAVLGIGESSSARATASRALESLRAVHDPALTRRTVDEHDGA
jgi:RNA polymerase sigma-70 factor (sigma-E family)